MTGHKACEDCGARGTVTLATESGRYSFCAAHRLASFDTIRFREANAELAALRERVAALEAAVKAGDVLANTARTIEMDRVRSIGSYGTTVAEEYGLDGDAKAYAAARAKVLP
jgi:hypothetical protein